MIVIDEYTETALTQRLETIQGESRSSRCIHLRFSDINLEANATVPVIQKYVETHIETTDQTQLFVCDDGDVYLIGYNIAAKNAQELVAYVGKQLAVEMKTIASLYELPAQVHPVLTSVDEKIQFKGVAVEHANESAQQEMQAQKTKAILSVVDEKKAKESIISNRQGRMKPQVMVIEDDAFTRTLVTNIMKKQYAIEGTGVPMEALQMYVRLAPDVLFLDINLPDVTGHELLTRILELDPDAFVVMLSGNADKENITKAIGAGAKGFVGKPFTKEKLLQYIEKRLEA